MAIDLKLNENYDLDIQNGDLVLVSDGDEVAQCAGIRLLTIQGEWFFDYTKGLPWFDNLLTTTTSYEQKVQLIKKAIRETPGVNRILTFSFGIDRENHKAEVEFEADTIYGIVSLKVGA